MDLWYPPDDQEPLLEWWTPLLAASAAARREGVRWPIHFEEFELQGRVDRNGRPPIWVYKHVRSLQELYLDDLGRAYKFTRTPNGRSFGRFTTCDIRTAIRRAGLPSHVDPILDDDERWPATGHHAASPDSDVGLTPAPPPRPRRKPRPGARRGHLTVIQGGRALPPDVCVAPRLDGGRSSTQT